MLKPIGKAGVCGMENGLLVEICLSYVGYKQILTRRCREAWEGQA